ncbi:hypothetical protein RYX36_009523 [Vicia faba]
MRAEAVNFSQAVALCSTHQTKARTQTAMDKSSLDPESLRENERGRCGFRLAQVAMATSGVNGTEEGKR